MKPFATKPLSLLGLFALAACTPARTAPAPAPAPARPAPTTPAPAMATALREAPREWQLLDDSLDHVPGVSARRAEQQLLAGKEPRRTVVVAVIDGGVDTAHADLRANLWRNPKEVAGNGKDDDGNGYADDVYGWNFIGGADGRDVQYDTHEVTRLYVRCMTGGTRAGTDTLLTPERCKAIAADFDKKKGEAQQLAGQVDMADAAMSRATQILKQAMHTDSLTADRVTAFKPGNSQQQEAKRIFLQLTGLGITPKAIAEAKEDVASRLQYGFNITYDSRSIVGDDPTNLAERRYGNHDVMGPDAKHGTHVSGIIGAVRGNNVGVDGIAPAVRIMMIRAVPDGDERDKDIANAIRYAVDNGAQIINMSFGKAYSPQKRAVDEAVKYADSKGVLMIHAAGNDGENVDTAANFPSPSYLDGGRAANWIEVGATSWKSADSLVASFSNYGQKRVDVFAPGVDILSTVPGGGYERESGTSMAAPVVTGVAALLMSYFPDLRAADVKRIILASATRRPTLQVLRPGDQQSGTAAANLVPFGSLSATGGIVNAYAAVKMAQEGK